MATPVLWKGVAVAMQSAVAAAISITAISKANPGVVTFTGTAPANGSYVLLAIQGMSQLDGRIIRVSASGTGTFTLEGEDTTLYDTFTTGNFQVLTLGTSITSAVTIASSGGDPSFEPTTTIHATVATSIPGLPSASVFSFDHIWDPTDPGQIAMRQAFINAGTRAFKFTFGAGGRIMVFNGYVVSTLIPAGTAQKLVTTPASITLTALPTYYAS